MITSVSTRTSTDRVAVDTIRTLTIDAIAAAKSGHPGAAIALAPVGFTIWNHSLRYDVDNPAWINRDRFVLSAGHASMLLYSLIHLAQIKDPSADRLAIELDDIKNFRQLGSRCAGHPEREVDGVIEATTGPLGTGIATSVGMAMASKWQGAHFNKPGYAIFDYRVFALAGDGDLMEGVGQEAASLAGHQRLDNLCWIYDSNEVTIEGSTGVAFTEDVAARFRSYGWSVDHVADANDRDAMARALDRFDQNSESPTLIIVNSVIGYGAPTKQGTAAAHSEPLGEAEARAAKRFYGRPEDSPFDVPDEAYEAFSAGIGTRGRQSYATWLEKLERYRANNPDLAKELDRFSTRELPIGWDDDLPVFDVDDAPLAARAANQIVLNAAAVAIPWLLGGASDLAPSTKTALDSPAGHFSPSDRDGRNLHFGVRESAAASAANGLALSGLRPFQAGFLVFSDFQRGPMRLGALMGLPVIHIFTHDSISMGEDGPTHQPIEQLASLRAMPNLIDIRPADANEVSEAWRVIGPITDESVALVLAKQDLPIIDRRRFAAASGLSRGAYVLADPTDGQDPTVILIGTGSEVHLCLLAWEALEADGIAARVVSMPSWALFERQDKAYRDSVLPPHLLARVTVEQASGLGWERYAGNHGAIIAMNTFGASAPGEDVRRKFGFTVDAIVKAARAQVNGTGDNA
ncbi:transketolase [Agreia bicolorata]|uniref:Transketolase n=1 Tax=Agreia bicolorata TaxID=110935 RepID=A0A1T4WWN3_9MICO|nr:transketolase [Agreia bicolorata]SKA81659.1 transketolase [Agreia bicolorata]